MRTRELASVVLKVVLTALLALPSLASSKELSIPAQTLSDSLHALSAQADVNVLFDPALARGLAPAINGISSVNEALKRLLNGTGLTHRFINARTVTIVPGQPAADAADGEVMRLAQSGNGGSAKSDSVNAALPPTIPVASSSSSEESAKDKIGEIIVTAQRREENLQDVPMSISVLSGDQLDKFTGQGVLDALTRVPGIAVTEQFPAATITIRGVAPSYNVFFGGSPTAYYLDSVPFGFVKSAFSPDSNAYDMERVEVLRGPQGTLYGASTLSGVVRVLTHEADLDRFELKGRTAVSSTDEGGENYRGDVAVNVPLIEGKLAARAVVSYQHLGGWIDQPVQKDVNDADTQNYRFKLNYRPTENLSFGLTSWFSRTDGGATSRGDDSNRNRSPLPDQFTDTDYDVLGLKIGYQSSTFSVTSATSYLDYGLGFFNDISLALNGSLLQTVFLDARVFSEEIYFNSTHEGPWRWSFGGAYRDADDEVWQNRVTSAGVQAGPSFLAPLDTTWLSESYAVFGELTRLFLDERLELTAGVRYFKDDTGIEESSRGTIAGGIPATGLVSQNRSFDQTAPRLVLTWHPGKQLTAYVSYSEGFRSGSDQNPSSVAIGQAAGIDLVPTEADKLKNYEIGVKSGLLDNRLALDAAVYYVDWKNPQVPLLLEPASLGTFGVANSGSVSGLGFDFGVTAKPVDALTINLNLSANDLTQDQDVFSGATLLFTAGERQSMSPKYTAGASADYAFPVGAHGYKGRVALSGNYTSERTIRLGSAASVSVNNKDLLITGARLALESPRDWTVSLFADNLNNERDSVLGIPANQSLLPDFSVRLRPRTVGLQLDFHF